MIILQLLVNHVDIFKEETVPVRLLLLASALGPMIVTIYFLEDTNGYKELLPWESSVTGDTCLLPCSFCRTSSTFLLLS